MGPIAHRGHLDRLQLRFWARVGFEAGPRRLEGQLEASFALVRIGVRASSEGRRPRSRQAFSGIEERMSRGLQTLAPNDHPASTRIPNRLRGSSTSTTRLSACVSPSMRPESLRRSCTASAAYTTAAPISSRRSMAPCFRVIRSLGSVSADSGIGGTFSFC